MASNHSTVGTSSLLATTERKLFKQLAETVQGYQSTANFACGGVLRIDPSNTDRFDNFGKNDSMTCPPVVLRWDTKDGKIDKVQFPVAGREDLTQLVKDCTPASFGFQGQNLLDVTYRQAGKLDSEQFSTNFNPYDYGIIAAVSQILLPSIMRPETNSTNLSRDHWGVVAELYKLNVYSGPTGKFQSHVDTPRSHLQFGSLVICLPYKHEGGQLRIKHKDVERLFDWADSDGINWAAFYSDCEHEVLQVKGGHRITLTYNLYVCEHRGAVLRPSSTTNPTLYPLYDKSKALLEQPGFMKNGGTLGFYCAHQYAHATNDANNRLPWALKGVDVVIFMVFQSLGLEVRVRPVMEQPRRRASRRQPHKEEDSFRLQTASLGTKFRAARLSKDSTEYMGENELIDKNWPRENLENITWLNTKTHRELSLAYLAYGNEAWIGHVYTHAAIMVTIPSFLERKDHLATASTT